MKKAQLFYRVTWVCLWIPRTGYWIIMCYCVRQGVSLCFQLLETDLSWRFSHYVHSVISFLVYKWKFTIVSVLLFARSSRSKLYVILMKLIQIIQLKELRAISVINILPNHEREAVSRDRVRRCHISQFTPVVSNVPVCC